MDYEAFVQHVSRDGRRLADAARDDLLLAVPSCPGWTTQDLVRHVAEVYEHKIACTELQRAPDPWPPAWPPERDPIEWLLDAHSRLLDLFASSGPTAPSATWWPPDQTVGFWARRMAHETAVHRVDAELAIGTPVPSIDAALAEDGIDEILDLMLEGDWSDEPDDASNGQRISTRTAGRRWVVTIERQSVAVAHDVSGDADAELEGEPSSVLLWLWGRAPDELVERSGDLDALRVFRARLALATQ